MGKKEFLNRQEDINPHFFDKLKISEIPGGNAPSKIPGLSNKAFAIIRFVLGLCILPFVYSFTTAFLNEFSILGEGLRGYFWSGIIIFLILHLFIFEPSKIYQKGQRLLEIVFHFFSPLVKVAPYVLPIYTILIFFLYLILALFIKSKDLINYFIFSFGFSLGLHMVFSAKSLRSKQDFFKANYIFGFSFVYIINIALAGLFLNLIFEKFSFVNFFNNAFQSANAIYATLFKQLFGT